MRSTFAAVAFFTALASAQIDPNTVPLADRAQWCVSQRAACPSLCAQQSPDGSMATASNTCDQRTLDYSCVCASGLSPNATEFSQTIPYFICTETNNNCVEACGMNSACASACREDNPCGARNPTRVNITSSATSSPTSGASGTGADAAETTGFDTFGGAGSGGNGGGSSGSQSTGSSSAAIKMSAISIGQTYGFVAVVGGLLAGFGLML